MTYRNSKTKQEMEVGDWETVKRQVLERSGWRKVDETPTIPPAGALDPTQSPTGDSKPTLDKDTQLDNNEDSAPSVGTTKPTEKPAAAPKPVKKAAK